MNCNQCKCLMIQGTVMITASGTGYSSLSFCSNKKYPKLVKSIWGKEMTKDRFLVFNLLKVGITHDYKKDSATTAWYCETCKKVFLEFSLDT